MLAHLLRLQILATLALEWIVATAMDTQETRVFSLKEPVANTLAHAMRQDGDLRRRGLLA